MSTPAAKRLRMLHSRVADGRALARAVCSAQWLADARVLKKEKLSTVLLGRVRLAPGEDASLVVVKTLELSRPKDFFSRLFSVTRGLRQWHGGDRLARRGFATGEQLALFRGIGANGKIRESIVLRWVEGKSLFDHIAQQDLSAQRERELAHAAGDLARRMVEAGLFNRDNKPSNIVLTWNEGAPELAMIDPVGVRAIEPWASERTRALMLEKMLTSLVVESQRTTHPRAKSLRWRAIRATVAPGDREAMRARWRSVERLVVEHRAMRAVVKRREQMRERAVVSGS